MDVLKARKGTCSGKHALLIILFPVLFFSGCLNIETKVIINKDGTGRIDEKVLMSRMFVDMLSSFAQSLGDSSETEEFSLFDEECQRVLSPKGVKFLLF